MDIAFILFLAAIVAFGIAAGLNYYKGHGFAHDLGLMLLSIALLLTFGIRA